MKNLKLFYDIKNKPHDASGVENPNLTYWYEYELDGVYYPYTEIEFDYHEEVREWMEEIGLPQISLDELNTETLTADQKAKWEWFMDTFYGVFEKQKNEDETIFDSSHWYAEINKIRFQLGEQYKKIVSSANEMQINLANLDDDDVEINDLPLVTIHGESYYVVSCDIEFLDVIPIDSPIEEEEIKFESFKHIDGERDMVYLLSKIAERL